MKLLDVKTNRYAYSKANGDPMDADGKIVINDVIYYKNDPISYWDYYLMSSAEKNLFEAETYVVIADCKIGNTEYKEGTVMTKSDYQSLRGNTPPAVTYTVTNPTTGEETVMSDKSFDYFFRSSNNLSHDTGYILTYRVNNPTSWDTWYTQVDPSAEGKDRMNSGEYHNEVGYEDGPTYRLIGSSELLGQREYAFGSIISQDVYTTYQAAATAHPEAIPTNDPDDPAYDPETVQAEFDRAWIVTDEITLNDEVLFSGSAVPESQVMDPENPGTLKAIYSGKVAEAYICTHTIQLAPTEYIYLGDKMTAAEKEAYRTKYATGDKDSNPDYNPELWADIDERVVPAYYCTSEGLYGGNYYETGKNYRGLEAWSSMSPADREKFTFNYDAFDLLIDPNYSGNQGQKWQYDGEGFTTEDQAKTNPAGYSVTKPVDYTASYNSDTPLSVSSITVKRIVDVEGIPTQQNVTTTTIQKGDELDRETFEEQLPNEMRHYSLIDVKDVGEENPYYVVKTPFQVGSTPYAVGTTISSETYNSLDDKSNIATLIFTTGQENQKFYYCRESYSVTTSGGGTTVTGVSVDGAESGTYSTSTDPVPVGLVIDATTYGSLVNNQKNFTIYISNTLSPSCFIRIPTEKF